MKKSKELFSIVVAVLGSFLSAYGVITFNQSILASLPLGMRMLAAIVGYWFIALVPILVMVITKDRLRDYGFTSDKTSRQVVIGLTIGILMSVILTLIPHLLGLASYLDSGKNYQYLWQFIFELIYCLFGVALTEEFIFRGLLYKKIKSIGKSDVIAVAASSLFFGFFHIFSGNLIQVFLTTVIGAFYCICRIKIKNCSTLSLIIAHGIYDALITLWAFLLL